ncbi:MAG: ABC transporter permease [Pleomorphochaeta sp.]|jgi:ribose transport system permease protein
MSLQTWKKIQRLFPFIGLAVVMILFTIICGEKIWARRNLINIINNTIPLAIGASGMVFVASQGSTDMSMGSLLAVAGTLGGMASLQYGVVGFIVVSIGVGIFFGFFMGVLLAYFKVNSLMITLAMLIALRAVVSYITNGQALLLDYDIIKMNALSIKLPFIIILLVFMWYLFSYTKIGFFSRCIGENEEVGRFSGINVKKYKILAFMLSGAMAGVVGILSVVKIGGVSPTIGNFFELQVMTAMFVGGIPIAGGSESKFYKVISGSFMLVLLQNGLTLARVSAEFSELIQGIILILVVFLNLYIEFKFNEVEMNTKDESN